MATNREEMPDIDLQSFRQQYPQYNEWSDARILRAIDRKNAAQKQPETQGLKGISEDVANSLQQLPDTAINFIPGMISGAGAAAKNVVQHPLRSALNVGAGVGEGAVAMGNLPSNIMDYLARKGLVSQERADKALHIPDLGIEKRLGLDKPDEGDKFLRMVSSLLVPGKAAKALIPERASAAVAPVAVGALAAGENQDPLQAAILAGLVHQSAKYAGKKIPEARRILENKYSSPLSDEELLSNMRAAGNTNTGLGRIINNPELMRELEVESRKYPGSGSEQILGETANQIKDIGHNLIDNIKGDVPIEHYGDAILQALKKSKNDAYKEKESKYKKVDELAEKHNVKTKRNNFINAANDELNAMESDPQLALFQNEGEKGRLQKIISDNQGNDYGLKDTSFLIGKLGDERQSHFQKGNTSEYNLYKKLHEALKKDRDEAIESSSAPDELKNAHNESNDFYKNEYSPFEDSDIAKWIRGKGDTDLLINHFIRKGKFSDRSKLIRKLQDKLPEEKKHILGSAYLSNAIKDGEFNPHQLRSLYKALGENQRNALFSPEHNAKLADYVKLVDMNPEPLGLMLNPRTGFRDSSPAKISDVVMPALLSAVGGHFGGIPTAIAAASIPYLASKFKPKYIVKPKVDKITSPTFREEFIKKLIESRKQK